MNSKLLVATIYENTFLVPLYHLANGRQNLFTCIFEPIPEQKSDYTVEVNLGGGGGGGGGFFENFGGDFFGLEN